MQTVTGTVEVKSKDAQGNEKVEKGAVKYPYFESSEDILSYLGDSTGEAVEFTLADGKTKVKVAPKMKEVLDALNYGVNLKARVVVRNEIQARLEGPDKAINKQVADFIKARAAVGKPVTEEQARKFVLMMMDMQVESEAAPEQNAEEQGAEVTQ